MADLGFSLYPHQESSIEKMQKLEEKNEISILNDIQVKSDIGILSDDFGFGKTISMLSLIDRTKDNYDTDKIFERQYSNIWADNHFTRTCKTFYQRVKANLILVNNHILSQWEKEISRFQLRYYKIFDSKSFHKTTLEHLQIHNIILVTPEFFNRLILDFKNIAWRRVIIDDPQSISISHMRSPISVFYWFMTAIPDLIKFQKRNMSSPNFIKDIVDTWNRYSINIFITINSTLNFEPTFNTNYQKHKSFEIYFKKYNFDDDIILDLIKKDNISQAVDMIGIRKVSNLYNFLLEQKTTKIKIAKDHLEFYQNIYNRNLIEITRNKIVELENSIKSLEEFTQTKLSEECPICYNKYENPILENNCKNLFCGKCLLIWLAENENCPCCRTQIEKTDLVLLEEVKENVKSKEEIILNLLNENKKFIIFAEENKNFEKLKKIFKEKNKKFIEYQKNSTINIKTNIILLTSKTQVGLDLPETTDIIFYENTNKEMEKQVIGRASRIGRTSELNIHNFY